MTDIHTSMRQAKREIRRETAKSLIVPLGTLITLCLLLAYTTHSMGRFPSPF